LEKDFRKRNSMGSVFDVARRADVSPATVSRVLSGSSHPVRRETRERVLRAAEELGFRPNMLARALLTARTHTVGAIVHDISDPYFAEIVRGIEDCSRLRDYRVFVCSSDRDPARELGYVRALFAYRVDGIVLAGGGIEDKGYLRELRKLLKAYEEQGGAVVTLAPHGYRATRVVADNRGGAAAMTRHLLALGHRRIAYVTGAAHIRTSAVRLAGYRAALEEAGVAFDPELVVSGEFKTEVAARAVGRLVERRLDWTAVFAASDVMAFGVMHELSRRGLRVPEDVSVAGFDDVSMSAYAHTPLTTVRIAMYEMGREGMNAVMALRGGARPRSRQLQTTVVERASTAPAPTPTRKGGQR
jgi:LacI family transcriptional regulator, galactose operon repressor